MGLSRRRFIKNSLGAAGLGTIPSGALGGPSALAAELTDRHFIFCYFPGGWDVLLTLDPRDPTVFRREHSERTGIEPGYHLLPEGFQQLVRGTDGRQWGPYIGDFAQIAHRATVVRGMSVDTLTHEVARRRFITGKRPRGRQAVGSSIATVLAAAYGSDRATPHLACCHESFHQGLPASASAVSVSGVEALCSMLRPRQHGSSSATGRRAKRWLQRSPEHLSDPALWPHFDFGNNSSHMQALREAYQFTSDQLDSPQARAALAVTAVTSGLARCVSISVCDNLDTHGADWKQHQGPRQMRGLNAVTQMVRDLESRPYGRSGETWLDRTVIIGYSDLSRSPRLNAQGGRDHWLGNSCFLIGAGIQEGAVLGASSDMGMAPQPVDLSTGELSASGEVVKPEHILRALCVDVGLHDDQLTDLGVAPYTAVLKTSS